MRSVPIIVFVLISTGVTTTAGKVPSQYQKSWDAAASPYKQECIEETGVNKSYADRLFLYSEYHDDDNLKCYLKCLCERLEIVNISSGTWNKNEILKHISGVTDEIYKTCSDETQDESLLCQKCFDLSKCIARHLNDATN
ncbi:hypothetical protein RI129_008953 [Pyrocoelia pectoralis]|uniref:Uncharacterized protein n=1 Tax=Pyrocoelia pectoralis TaxID=417401 RepID=A0AAN7ZLI9_9COLE